MPHMQPKLFEDNFSSHSCLTFSFIAKPYMEYEDIEEHREIKSLYGL